MDDSMNMDNMISHSAKNAFKTLENAQKAPMAVNTRRSP
jgi:hypothetical protein